MSLGTCSSRLSKFQYIPLFRCQAPVTFQSRAIKGKKAAKEIIKQKAKETKEEEAREREGKEESNETILHYLQLLAPSHLCFNEPTCQGRGSRGGTSISRRGKKKRQQRSLIFGLGNR